MSQRSISTEEGDAWRDFLLQQVVAYLENNRDNILERFEQENVHGLSRELIEEQGLLDFDVSITLHRDRKPSFGLGAGFFKANLIR